MVASDIPERDDLLDGDSAAGTDSSEGPMQGSAGTAIEEESKPTLEFEFDVEAAGTCKRRVIVTIPRKEVDRYFAEEFDKIRNEATVPGFRPGRVPRRLLEKRFRNELREPVKNRLMLDAFWALVEQAKLAPISDPDLDPDAVELPDEGDFAFEFSVEVRPEFPTPQWRGLKLRKKVYQCTPEYLEKMVGRRVQSLSSLDPVNEPAQMGDCIDCDITLRYEGRVLSSADHERIVLRPRLTFIDGVIPDFGQQMVGVRAGESRFCNVEVSDNCPDPNLAGKTVQAQFKVHAVLRVRPVDNLDEVAREVGYESAEALKKGFEEEIQARLEQETYEDLRRQVLDQLIHVVPTDLPEDLVKRQTEREVRRRAVELARAGYSSQEIQQQLNFIAREARSVVVRLLREHFLLERLAEEEKIEATPEDIDAEIERIARRTMRSPRRVRAEYEQENAWDVLRNAIIERKMIERIIEAAELTEEVVPLSAPEESTETAVDFGVVKSAPEREEEPAR